MRVFVLMLLVLNLAFFCWQYLGDSGQSAEDEMSSTSTDSALAGPSLVLVKEAVPPATTRKQVELSAVEPVTEVESPIDEVVIEPQTEVIAAAAMVKPEPVARCYKVGPFEQRQQPSEMALVAERYGFEAAITARQVERLFGEWVYLSGYSTLAAARADVASLKAQGIRDISIARLDEGQLIISLGIFGQQKSLKRRLDEVGALGYVNYQQRKRYRKAEEFWLVLSGFAGEPQQSMLEDLNALLSEHFSAVELQTVDCG